MSMIYSLITLKIVYFLCSRLPDKPPMADTVSKWFCEMPDKIVKHA